MSERLAALCTRDALLAVGFTLLIAGVFLRGFARSTRRALALRREHALHLRRLDADRPTTSEATVQTTHFERQVARYAMACVGLGGLLVVVAFFRA